MPDFRVLAAIAPQDGACAHRGTCAHRGACTHRGTPAVQIQDRTTGESRNHYTGMNPVL